MRLTNLEEIELRTVQTFLNAVATERTWRVEVPSHNYRRCILLEAQIPEKHDSGASIDGWMVFRGIRQEQTQDPRRSVPVLLCTAPAMLDVLLAVRQRV